MDQIDRLEELPNVEEALKLPYEEYRKYADGFLEYKTYCQFGWAEAIDKVQEWCVHLKCLNITDPCTPLSPSDIIFSNTKSNLPENVTTSTIAMVANTTSLPTPFASNVNQTDSTSALLQSFNHSNNTAFPIFNYMLSIGYNNSKCYDDYMCDRADMSAANHFVLGVLCFTLCFCGLVSNLVLLPAYNFKLNRSGATVYLTAMALFDCIYLIASLLVSVSHYMPATFMEQMVVYGQFTGFTIPIGLPTMQLCELLVVGLIFLFGVVWLVLALLINRLLYLNLGFQSKLLCAQIESVKIIIAIVVLGAAYMGCKFLEYTYVEYENPNVVRVVLTQIGKDVTFQNIMYHWLKVPLEMFLPYLSTGVLVSVVVSKMVNLHNSKWKAVASLCNETACACVCRSGVCGTECREGVKTRPGIRSRSRSPESHLYAEQPGLQQQQQSQKLLPTMENLDPIEQELAYLFFQLPALDETRENANVVTAVCIGLLLLVCKVPKFLLHIIATEHYISYDPAVFAIINQFLDTTFAACKPLVCILIGAHFRRALLSPPECCCCRPGHNSLQQSTHAAVSATNGLEACKLPSGSVEIGQPSVSSIPLAEIGSANKTAGDRQQANGTPQQV